MGYLRGLEDAAKVCDDLAQDWKYHEAGDVVQQAAKEIRSLQSSEPQQGNSTSTVDAQQPQAPGAVVPQGYVLVPLEPTPGLLMSMALRMDHALGCPGYYDQPMMGHPEGTHAQRVEQAIADMRRAHEEVTGQGFYRPEREADYNAMAQATGSPQPATRESGGMVEAESSKTREDV